MKDLKTADFRFGGDGDHHWMLQLNFCSINKIYNSTEHEMSTFDWRVIGCDDEALKEVLIKIMRIREKLQTA